MVNGKDPASLQGLNEYGSQLIENIVFYTAGKRQCFDVFIIPISYSKVKKDIQLFVNLLLISSSIRSSFSLDNLIPLRTS